MQTVNNGVMVDIIWAPSPNDRSSLVFEYRVKLKRSDGALIEHPECQMSAKMLSELKCSVSMTSLMEADFHLVEGDLIEASVEALNNIDFSLPSEPSGSATV